jgi:hypothetical protein
MTFLGRIDSELRCDEEDHKSADRVHLKSVRSCV